MNIVRLIYKDGSIQDKDVTRSHHIHGAKINGQRPIRAIMPRELEGRRIEEYKRFLHDLHCALHPMYDRNIDFY